MSSSYIPPPPKIIRQLRHCSVSPSASTTPLAPIVAIDRDIIVPPVSEEDCEEDPYKYSGVPPRVEPARKPCDVCGCNERLVGYGIQFNPNARYDGAEVMVSMCRKCDALLSYQI